MAAPFVSGAAALARQKQPTASATEVTSILTGSGRDITQSNDAKYAGKLGHLLDIGTAVAGSSPIIGGPDRLYIPLVFSPEILRLVRAVENEGMPGYRHALFARHPLLSAHCKWAGWRPNLRHIACIFRSSHALSV